jgi:hypothetical protein
MQCWPGHARSAFHFEQKRKYTLNATELARNKFNALFAHHDEKDTRAGSEEQKPPVKIVKKADKK